MTGTLADKLTKEEINTLSGMMDITRFEDPMQETEIMLAVCQVRRNTKGNSTLGKSLTEITDGNKEAAKLLMKAYERKNCVEKDYFYEQFVFENKDPRDEDLRKSLTPDLVRQIRERTGLSQKNFASKYDLSLRSVESWETGARMISKCAYEYLKEVITKGIPMIHTVKELTLPLDMLSDEDKEYLKDCTKNNDPREANVSHTEENVWQGEAYTLMVENTEDVAKGKMVHPWDAYPDGIQSCVRAAVRYDCNQIKFSTEDEYSPRTTQLLMDRSKSMEERLEELFKNR